MWMVNSPCIDKGAGGKETSCAWRTPNRLTTTLLMNIFYNCRNKQYVQNVISVRRSYEMVSRRTTQRIDDESIQGSAEVAHSHHHLQVPLAPVNNTANTEQGLRGLKPANLKPKE